MKKIYEHAQEAQDIAQLNAQKDVTESAESQSMKWAESNKLPEIEFISGGLPHIHISSTVRWR